MKSKHIPISDIEQLSVTHFRVKSQESRLSVGKFYDVQTDIGVCSCPDGVTGHGCKHQAAVSFHFQTANPNFSPSTIEEKQLFTYLSCGTHTPRSWWEVSDNDIVEICETESKVVFTVQCENNKTSSHEDLKAESNSAGNSNPNNDIDSLIDDLSQFHLSLQARLKDRLTSDWNHFEPAVRAFIKNGKKALVSDSKLVSSLHTFTKYTGVTGKYSSARIKLQPAALMRRKYHLPGKVLCFKGRPANEAKEKMKRKGAFQLLPNKRRKIACHNLSQNVSQNKNNAKTHQIK